MCRGRPLASKVLWWLIEANLDIALNNFCTFITYNSDPSPRKLKGRYFKYNYNLYFSLFQVIYAANLDDLFKNTHTCKIKATEVDEMENFRYINWYVIVSHWKKIWETKTNFLRRSTCTIWESFLDLEVNRNTSHNFQRCHPGTFIPLGMENLQIIFILGRVL